MQPSSATEVASPAPPGAEWEEIRFLPAPAAGAAPWGDVVVATFLDPRGCVAAARVVAAPLQLPAAAAPTADLTLAWLPAESRLTDEWDVWRRWLAPAGVETGVEIGAAGEFGGGFDAHSGEPGLLLITMQGVQLAWTPGRAVVAATPDRRAAPRAALVEFVFQETELRQVERAVRAAWPELEQPDLPTFDCSESALPRRDELAARLRQALAWRAVLLRLAPKLRAPSPYPPTLAGQLADRLRERAGQLERWEVASEQVELFERVYELCGQRVSDHALNRRQNILEWIIILLLATEVVLLLVDLLAASAPAGV